MSTDTVPRLRETIAARLRDEIVAGGYRDPGALKLSTLSARFDVSATPIREALAILEHQGLVISHPHRRHSVVGLTAADVGDVYAMHAFILRILARRAAELITDEQMAALDQLEDELWKAMRSGDLESAIAANHELHVQINEAARSPFLVRFLRASTPFVSLGGDLETTTPIDSTESVLLLGHSRLLDAIRVHDGELAGQLMYEHLLHNGEAAKSRFDRALAGSGRGRE